MAIQTSRVLPAGTLTFLFTDIEGSTRRWESAPDMHATLARHDGILREIIVKNGGTVFKTVGDAFCCVFTDAQLAIATAAEIQQRIGAEDWGERGELRVRAALHTGTAQQRDRDYFGPTVNRVARLLGEARGGEVILSASTERLIRDHLSTEFSLADLGDRTLKGVETPVHIYRLSYPGMVVLPGKTAANFVPNNLNEDLSKFVGRGNELRRLQKLLHGHRLVSIVGPGGVGKTRLALQLARTILQEYPGGVWFVELSDPTVDVAVSVATVMGLPVTGRDPLQAIIQNAGVQPLLFVLDDSEQNLAAIAAFVRNVLAGSSRVRVVATSRERLHVDGEQCVSLEPLDVPDASTPYEELKKFDSVKLVLDRVHGFHPSFQLDRTNGPAIASICETLDGIPLALELAAARLRALSPQQIVDRLTEQFALLTGGNDAAAHHRTLRAAIEWSYKLLDDRERLLFARLAVFRGAFTLDAVEAVCSDVRLGRYDVFDVLAALIEKSFAQRADIDGVPRFRLLHTIRAYALELLESSDERSVMESAHYTYHRDLVKRFSAASGDEQKASMDSVEHSHADVLAALDRALENRDPECAELALQLVNFWVIRSYYCQSAAVLEKIAASGVVDDIMRAMLYIKASTMRNAVGEYGAAKKDAETGVQVCENGEGSSLADALSALAGVHSNMGAYESARPLYDRALGLYRQCSDSVGEANTLLNLSIVETGLSEFDLATMHAKAAIGLCEKFENKRQLAWAYGALGNAAHQAGAFAEARAQYDIALGICRRIGYKTGITTCLNHLALVALEEGSDSDAQAFTEESLTIAWELSLSLQLADALEAAARILVRRENCDAAARLFGSVDAMRRRMSFPFLRSEKSLRDEHVNRLICARSQQWYDELRAQGETMDASAVLRIARTSLSASRVHKTVSHASGA